MVGGGASHAGAAGVDLAEGARQAEVDNFERAVGLQEHVPRLEVAVDDAPAVEVGQHPCQLDADPQHRHLAQRAVPLEHLL